MADEAATRRREEPYRNVNRAPPRRNTRDEFPEFKKILMGPWVSGVEYGPVLEPQIARKLGSLTLHPVFTRPYKPDKYLDWDILQDVENATMHLPGGRKIPCESFGTQPATAPRVSSLCVVSPDFPWRFQVTSRMWRGYVTIFDVLECLEFAFRGHLHVEELSEKPANDVCDSMETAKAERIARKFGPSYLCQADFLQGKRKIQGFEADLQYAPKGPVDERYVFIQLYIGS
ncbi:hypothetical protein CYLTODRAFT_458690 [Cylindrobasidium torrendii FP15055 ss-10]|uniref:DUF6699 domain-containing protein n=1 Tax=Cylindrobasidium torrendii FP15055 ss-10 TaxID=1314674 RepID=A0A0D7AX58_9AGAR|nr:hypothetical protein CYLTODRAFT_458690 [Cylindrobasidium torrendii FP15055 ss-10]